MPDGRHPADQAVTLPKKQRKSICILDEAVVGEISDGQHTPEDALDTACGLYLGDPTAWT